MDTLNLKFALFKLNPFLISLGFHSLALAAVIYGGGQQKGLPLSSLGDLSIELVGVDGGQAGQAQDPKSSTEKGQSQIEKTTRTVAKKKKAIVPTQQKVDEFSVARLQKQKNHSQRDTPNKNQESLTQKSQKAQQSQALNVSEATSSGLAGRAGSQGGGSLHRTYIQNLYTHLERNKHYPMLARKMRIEGQVNVSFQVLRDGTIKNVQLLEPCGSEVLNQAAIKTVKKASGQWPFPSSIREEALPLQISFNFQIH